MVIPFLANQDLTPMLVTPLVVTLSKCAPNLKKGVPDKGNLVSSYSFGQTFSFLSLRTLPQRNLSRNIAEEEPLY